MITPIEAENSSPVRPLRDGFARLPGWQRGALILIPLALVGAAGAKLADQSPAVAAVPPPAAVTVAAPLVRQVSEWDDYVGRFAPSRSVEIRPRVAGEVTGIHFRDGEIVRKGQLLFTIDARPFAAALAEARANAASASSALALARTDLGRATQLIDDEAISAGEVDSLRAKVQAASAALAAANARVRARALDVEFTQVRAPISGRISDRKVDAGNQVAGGEGTGGTVLTTINALDPIYFSFDGSEALYLKTQRERQPGAEAAAVEIQLQDESEHRWKGKLDFTDNGLDQRSGTIRGRAVLSNPNYFLTPGMFGNMRLASSGTANALLVPDAAIQTDQVRKVVMTVDAQNQVVAKPVTLGPVVDGLRIIRSGLTPKDRVIIAGIQMAMPGSKVAPRLGKISGQAQAPAPQVSLPVAGEATLGGR
ncbi:efflux RND transporter periplasmic adaptor subunit [Sphingomonas sp. So64.6b]|uniref:efflux RND transporter periplasmic adaptor subunit n=1 Tax=Sphingomonas sp. So64.6b TaxID=2997354 RepID=UPI00160138DA|nr:efflux RND transporter periplasmic adaptor subunit [Sphingomonas sp. So64.6b]QNA87196.1 efflux RND transporter periplasmic adaptor subunit [Sphingomonas sp. So64.6b]